VTCGPRIGSYCLWGGGKSWSGRIKRGGERKGSYNFSPDVKEKVPGPLLYITTNSRALQKGCISRSYDKKGLTTPRKKMEKGIDRRVFSCSKNTRERQLCVGKNGPARRWRGEKKTDEFEQLEKEGKKGGRPHPGTAHSKRTFNSHGRKWHQRLGNTSGLKTVRKKNSRARSKNKKDKSTV